MEPFSIAYEVISMLIRITVPLLIIFSVTNNSLNSCGVRNLASVVFAGYECIKLIYRIYQYNVRDGLYIYKVVYSAALFVISLIIVIIYINAMNNKKIKLPVILILIVAVLFLHLYYLGSFYLTYTISMALTCCLLMLCAYFDSRSILCEAKPKRNVPHREQIEKSIDETERKLRQLQSDFDSGRLDRDEFEKRRAEIIKTL